MNNSEPLKTGVDKQNKKIYIQEAEKEFISINRFREMVRDEYNLGIRLSHDNLLNYNSIIETSDDISITFDYHLALRLNDALLNKNFDTNKTSDSKSIILQLLDVVEYLHKRNICHFNIKPANILICKKDHHLFLYNLASTYINDDISFFIFSGKYCAPECFNDKTKLTKAADIYSIGKIIELVYSHSKLSYGINRIIKKATNKNPGKRYHNIQDIRKDLNNADKINFAFKAIQILIVLILVGFGIKECKKDDTCDVNFKIDKFNMNAKAKNSYENDIAKKTIDTMTLDIDTSKSVMDKYFEMCERSFREQFTLKARNIINSIYTKETMNGDKENFINNSKPKLEELDSIQRNLTVQYSISQGNAMQIATDIISKLTDDRLKYLNKQKR